MRFCSEQSVVLHLLRKQSQYEGFQSGCCKHGIARGLQSERDDTERAVPRTGERYYVGGYRKRHDDARCGPDKKLFLYLHNDICIIYGDYALWAACCNQCGKRKELSRYGSFDYERKAYKYDVRKGFCVLYRRLCARNQNFHSP